MNVLCLFQNYNYFKILFLHIYLYFKLTHNNNHLLLDMFKINYLESNKFFCKIYFLTFTTLFWIKRINLSMIKTCFILQTYTYSNLITTSMVESLQNKMVMHLASDFKSKYYLYDHTLIFLV